MSTVDEYRSQYARSSDQDLLAIANVDAEHLTPEARQALAEELARRELRPAGRSPYLGTVPLAPGAMPGALGNRRYTKAPFGARVLAYIIDAVIGAGAVAVAGIVVGTTHWGERNSATSAILFGAAILWALVYSFVKDGREGGQSFGKEMLNLMVVNVNTNQPCTMGESALRALVWFALSLIPLVGWLIEPIVALAADDGRRLGDKAAGTQVISTNDYIRTAR